MSQHLGNELMQKLTETIGEFCTEHRLNEDDAAPIVLAAVLSVAGSSIAEFSDDDPEEALKLVREKYHEAKEEMMH